MESIKIFETEEEYLLSSFDDYNVSLTEDSEKVWVNEIENEESNYIIAHYSNVDINHSDYNRMSIAGDYFYQYLTELYVDDIKQDLNTLTEFNVFYFKSNGEHVVKFVFDLEKLDSFYQLFAGNSALISVDFSHFDTSNINDMYALFGGSENLVSINFGEKFNTSNVTDMGCMFENCTGLTSLDLSNFVTSNVTYMNYMLCDIEEEIVYGLDNFDFSSCDEPTTKDNLFKCNIPQ